MEITKVVKHVHLKVGGKHFSPYNSIKVPICVLQNAKKVRIRKLKLDRYTNYCQYIRLMEIVHDHTVNNVLNMITKTSS